MVQPSADDQVPPQPALQPMPSRGERGAPTADLTRPRTLIRYFKDLESLFVRAGITTDADKKNLATHYVEMEVEDVWTGYPEFKNQAKTYDEFKKAIIDHYPEASGEYLYALSDIDTLIGERHRLGIRTLTELITFHNQFEAITSWLLDKGHISMMERSRAYPGAFQPHLWSMIETRICITNPKRHPNLPYDISDIFNTAKAILQGPYNGSRRPFTSETVPDQQSPVPVAPVAINNGTPEPAIKMENFSAILAELNRTIAELANQTRNRNNYGSSSRNVSCNMCGGDHYIRECKVVDEYIAAGKCRRNIEGKVVLSTGAYVPREIPGTLLSERIDEWHRRFPGQLAAATLIHTIDKDLLYPPQPTYQLTSSDRIAHLEAELYALKTRRSTFVPIVRTRAQAARSTNVESSDEEEEEAPKEVPKKVTTPKVVVAPPETRNNKVSATESVQPPPTAAIELVPETEHPFRNARDAAYAPPTERNVGTPPPVPPKKAEPAYRTQPTIYNAAIATDVYSRAMDLPITVTQRELWSLSPEVRAQVREATVTRRIPTQGTKETTVDATAFLRMPDSDDEDDEDEDEKELPAAPTFAIPYCQHRVPPDGALVIPDPIESYVKSLPKGVAPDPERLIAANENAAVRSVLALVDNNRKKECILDSGCQVVTISKAVSHELAISYDPTFRISMQSANGELDMSLGLARNVPFKIGPVTFYMQAHVIDSPAYDVLLGRPFDVLTESVIRNFANEEQTITIHDPNTGQHITVPTLARGTHKAEEAARKKDF